MNILWDWNGTLLNDLDICVDIINSLLVKRGHALLTNERYQQIFTFPVKDYYEAAGFDFEVDPFELVAVEFMDLYREKIPSAKVFSEVRSILNTFKEMGFKQYVISAMEHEFLTQTLEHKGLTHFFEGISGIHNDLAHGKTDMAKNFVKNAGIIPEQAVFIGDTLHDLDVAKALGTECVLVASGHQSFERLNMNGNLVVHSLAEIRDIFIY